MEQCASEHIQEGRFDFRQEPTAQRFRSTSYGWKAPIAGQPRVRARSRLRTTLHSRALLPPFGLRAYSIYRNDLPELCGAAPGNWCRRHWLGNPAIAGRCHSRDWRDRWTATNAVRRPTRRRSQWEPAASAGLMGRQLVRHNSFYPNDVPERDRAGPGNWCRRHLPDNPRIGRGRHSQPDR